MRLRYSPAFGSFVCLVTLAGCSDPYAGRVAISGTVKIAGQPLKEGTITFLPLDKQDTQSGTGITVGAYAIPRQNGLKPGKYLIQITAGDGVSPAKEEEAAQPGGSRNIVSWDIIPEEWGVKSTKQVEVKADGPNTFDFEIPNVRQRRRS